VAAEAVVSIQALRKRFGTNEVLRGIDLQMARGEVVAIIGKSGSGKSTLPRCINGLEEFQEGALQVDGQSLRHGDAKAMRALRQHVGMIFQSFNFFAHLSVGRNVMLPRAWCKACAARRPRSVRARNWRAWAWARSSTPGRTSSPVASSGAWPSPVRWPWTRRCCCATRSPPRSTPNWWARC
jgi:ABC-type sugar transport system ATPase subunit